MRIKELAQAKKLAETRQQLQHQLEALQSKGLESIRLPVSYINAEDIPTLKPVFDTLLIQAYQEKIAAVERELADLGVTP